MEAVRIKKVWANVKFHARILLRGFCRTIYGATIAGLIALSVFWFFYVSKGTGWIAVLKFFVACVLLAEGLGQMYLIGRNKKGNSGNKEIRK